MALDKLNTLSLVKKVKYMALDKLKSDILILIHTRPLNTVSATVDSLVICPHHLTSGPSLPNFQFQSQQLRLLDESWVQYVDH